MEQELNQYLIKDLVNIIGEYSYPDYSMMYKTVLEEYDGILERMRISISECQFQFGMTHTFEIYRKGIKSKTVYYCIKCDNLKFIGSSHFPRWKNQCWKNHSKS